MSTRKRLYIYENGRQVPYDSGNLELIFKKLALYGDESNSPEISAVDIGGGVWGFNFGNKVIRGVADGVDDTDLVNKLQMETADTAVTDAAAADATSKANAAQVAAEATAAADATSKANAAQAAAEATAAADATSKANAAEAAAIAAAAINAASEADDGRDAAIAVANTKLPLAGGTMSGDINMDGSKITGLAAGTDPNDVVTKAQMDSQLSGLHPIKDVDGVQTDDTLDPAGGAVAPTLDQSETGTTDSTLSVGYSYSTAMTSWSAAQSFVPSEADPVSKVTVKLAPDSSHDTVFKAAIHTNPPDEELDESTTDGTINLVYDAGGSGDVAAFASDFSPTDDGKVRSIQVTLSNSSGEDCGVMCEIYEDNAGAPAMSSTYSSDEGEVSLPDGTSATTFTFNFTDANVTSATTYWVVIAHGAGSMTDGAAITVAVNSSGGAASADSTDNGMTWSSSSSGSMSYLVTVGQDKPDLTSLVDADDTVTITGGAASAEVDFDFSSNTENMVVGKTYWIVITNEYNGSEDTSGTIERVGGASNGVLLEGQNDGMGGTEYTYDPTMPYGGAIWFKEYYGGGSGALVEGSRYIILDYDNLHSNFTKNAAITKIWDKDAGEWTATSFSFADNDIVECFDDGGSLVFGVKRDVPDGSAHIAWNKDDGKYYMWDETSWSEFGGLSGITAGNGLSKDGNVMNVNFGAGIKILPTDEVGLDLSATGGLELTPDEGSGAQLGIKDLGVTDEMLESGFTATGELSSLSYTAVDSMLASTSESPSMEYNNNSTESFAQSFVPNSSGDLGKVAIRVSGVTGTCTLGLELWTESSGELGSLIATADNTIDVEQSDSQVLAEFLFNEGNRPALVSATTYFWLLKHDGTSVRYNAISVHSDSSASGYSNFKSTDDGDTYSAASVGDIAFSVSKAVVTSSTTVDKFAKTGSGGILDLSLIPTVDEDTMASDSDEHVPTQQSVKAYVDAAIAANGVDYGISGTAAANITSGQIVYIKANGQIAPAEAATTNIENFRLAIATENKTTGQTVSVQFLEDGEAAIAGASFSSLNQPVYLQLNSVGSGLGKATQDPSDIEDNDTTSQRVLYRIGYAVSATEVQIDRKVVAIFPAE